MEMISQDDINALMGENYDEADRENETAETENLLIEVEADDQSDGLIVVEETAAPAMEDDIPEDDDIIDEADAVDVLDCLITQKTLDDLTNRSDNEPTADSDPVILDDEPEQDLEAAPVSDAFFDSNDPGVEEDALLNDAEDLLKLDFNDEEEVTQDDMDTLLLETGDGADDDEEDDDEEDEYDENDAIVISQDDIDTLLMSADQEDEDVLGSLMDDEFDGSSDTSSDVTVTRLSISSWESSPKSSSWAPFFSLEDCSAVSSEDRPAFINRSISFCEMSSISSSSPLSSVPFSGLAGVEFISWSISSWESSPNESLSKFLSGIE